MKIKIVLLIALSILTLLMVLMPGRYLLATNVTATLTPISPIPSPKLPIKGTDGVDQTDIDDVMNGIALAQSFISKHMGGDIPESTLAQYFVNFGETPMSQGPKADGCCHTKDDGIYLDPHYEKWSVGVDALAVWPDMDHLFHMHTAAHEYTHLLQHTLGCVGEHYYYLPQWIVEGMADYVGWQSVIEGGYQNAKRFWEEQQRDLAGTVPLSVPLSYVEPRDYNPRGLALTPLSDMAVEMLVNQTPDGVLALRKLCESAATSHDWKKDFSTIFGITPKAFYKQFEAVRRNPVVKVGISGTVTLEDGSPARGYTIWACNAPCHAVTVAPDGSYKIPLPDRAFLVSVTPPTSDRNKLYTERYNLYYSSETPTHLTPYSGKSTEVTVKGNLVTGIDMIVTTLPTLGITGKIKSNQGKPLVNMLLTAYHCPDNPQDGSCRAKPDPFLFQDSFDYSDPTGDFFVRVPEGEYFLTVQCKNNWGFYGVDGFVKDVKQAILVAVTDNKVTQLNIKCP
jgi:hypothetical protein